MKKILVLVLTFLTVSTLGQSPSKTKQKKNKVISNHNEMQKQKDTIDYSNETHEQWQIRMEKFVEDQVSKMSDRELRILSGMDVENYVDSTKSRGDAIIISNKPNQ